MDDYWIEKAHQYLEDHRAFRNIGDICKTSTFATISAEVSVGLPARFLESGITQSGVRATEPVRFRFEEEFPLKAPLIMLREDFPRSFPHINPSKREVTPCIYDGDLSELLQQSEWMNGILNQLVDWLEKAASGSLINYSQGWEPMRNDLFAGYIAYDIYRLLDFIERTSVGSREIYYEELNNLVFATFGPYRKEASASTLVICRHPDKSIQQNYIPNRIINLSDLYAFARSIGMPDLKKIVEEYDLKYLDQEKMFVALAIYRPCNIINSDQNVEVLNFVISKAKSRKSKKRVLPDCPVRMLAHVNETSPQLMAKMSGTTPSAKTSLYITLLGCGSLGSKIGLHLARAGNEPFFCIDHDLFLPHNNARHGLSLTLNAGKARQLALSIMSILGRPCEWTEKPAGNNDYSKSRIVIDTTASLAVRAFLMMQRPLPSITSHAIYGGGKLGISFIEAAKKSTKLVDLWAAFYRLCLERDWLREIVFSPQTENVAIGQGCGSHTMVMKDATISLFAASMSLMIQNYLEKSLPENGEIVLTRTHNSINLVSETFEVTGDEIVPSRAKRLWSVRILRNVVQKMKEQSMEAGINETGGCLLGSVFTAPKSIVVTDILPPPLDSISTPTTFILGTVGLEQRVKSIERRTNGKVTYLGTWHSHPTGGDPSQTDQNTAIRLLFVRNYEPTVCLIWTPEGVLQV